MSRHYSLISCLALRPRPSLRLIERVDHGPREQRNHDLVMAGDLVAFPAVECWALHHIHAWPILALHVEIDRHEVARLSAAEVARDRQRLEKDFRHDDRAAEVQHDAAVVEIGERRGETTKVA